MSSPILLRTAEVIKRTGLSRAMLFRLQKSGEFPRNIPLVGTCRAWVSTDVQAWVDAKVEAARKGAR